MVSESYPLSSDFILENFLGFLFKVPAERKPKETCISANYCDLFLCNAFEVQLISEVRDCGPASDTVMWLRFPSPITLLDHCRVSFLQVSVPCSSGSTESFDLKKHEENLKGDKQSPHWEYCLS